MATAVIIWRLKRDRTDRKKNRIMRIFRFKSQVTRMLSWRYKTHAAGGTRIQFFIALLKSSKHFS